MLTEHGMVEAEFTVARLGPDRFYLTGAAMGELRYLDWMRSHIRDSNCGKRTGGNVAERVTVLNRSGSIGVLAMAGPASRDILQPVAEADLSNSGGGWLSVRRMRVAGVEALALRISFTGELGWEFHLPMEDLPILFDTVVGAGRGYGLGAFGSLALNSMRIEKGYRVSADMTQEVTAYEAGLMRFVDPSKEGYIGRAALAANMEAPRWKLALLDIEAADADPLGGEGVFVGGRRVGVVTTAGYGHTIQRSLAWAYVNPGLDTPGTRLDVLVLGEPVPARVLEGPPWDPTSVRPRR